MSIIVSILDTKSGMWIKPYEVLNTQVAIRGFVASFRASSNTPMLKDYPEDYSLYLIARFNDEVPDEPTLPTPLETVGPTLILSGEEASAMADMLDKREQERVRYKNSEA